MSVKLREGFLTVAEVAEYLRLSRMTVYRLVNSGQLESVRIGRSFRISEVQAANYLARLENQEETVT
jgi:excisionase family DNA binding protein